MKLLKKRFKSMALFGAILCTATTVVPTIAEQPAAAANYTWVGSLQIRGSIRMDRNIYRPLNPDYNVEVVNACVGAVDIDLYGNSVPGLRHLAAHRTECNSKGTGFGGVENLRAGDTMTVTIDGVATEYEWFAQETFDRRLGAMNAPPVGSQVVLQTSMKGEKYKVHLEYFRPALDPPAGNRGTKITQGRPACVKVPGAQKGNWVFTNVTPVAGERSGYVTVYPAGRNDVVPNPNTAPATSTANWTSSAASPNTTLVQAGDGGKICAAAYGGAVHVLFDALAIGSTDKFTAPRTRTRRLIDTRSTGGLVTNRNQCFKLPDETKNKWTVLNLTAIGRSNGWGKLQTRGNRNTYSNVNFRNGDIDANMVIIKVPSNGELCYYSSGSSHAIVDFIATAHPNTFKNDSRLPGRPMGRIAADRRVQAVDATRFSANRDEWAFINATPIPQGGGFATLYNCEKYPGSGSDVNYSNRIDPNVAVVKMGDPSRLCIGRDGGQAAWVLDALAVAPGKTFATPSLRRIYDSRER